MEEQEELIPQKFILPKLKDCLVLLSPFLKESYKGTPTQPHTHAIKNVLGSQGEGPPGGGNMQSQA